MKSNLQNILIYLNKYFIVQFCFKQICKIQLAIIKLCFMRNKHFDALILRRKNVIDDFYVGHSDYDITCVANMEAASCRVVHYYAVIYRILKTIFFPLGEMKLIDRKSFSRHMYYNWVNYEEYPDAVFFLYKRNTVSVGYNPEKLKNICVYQKIYQIFFNYIISELYARPDDYAYIGLVFSRNLCKNAEKIKTLAGLLKRNDNRPALNYNKLPGQKINFMLSQKEREAIVSKCEMIVGKGFPELKLDNNFTFKTKGGIEFMNGKIISDLNDIFNPVIKKHYSSIRKLIICNYRLYKTSKMIILQHNDDLPKGEKNSLYQSVKEACMRLEPFNDILIKPFPFIFDSVIWSKFVSSEKISFVMSHCSYYDFLNQEISDSNEMVFSINKDFIHVDLEEATDLVNSYVRNQSPLYLLELIFGHMMLYNDLLTTGIMELSFERLYDKLLKNKCNSSQNRIIDLYRREDYDKLKKIDSLNVWKAFEGIIRTETVKSQEFLDKAY